MVHDQALTRTTSPNVVVLPGMDGGVDMLRPFLQAAPSSVSAVGWELPSDVSNSYESLCDYFSPRIEAMGGLELVAESFSGPLGIMLAFRFPHVVRRLTLVNTFVATPIPFAARCLTWPLAIRCQMPRAVLRFLMSGGDVNWEMKLQKAMDRVPAHTLRARLRCLKQINTSRQFASLSCPLLVVKGRGDRLLGNRPVRLMLAANPLARLVEIDGPHLLLQTRPKQVWNSILNNRPQWHAIGEVQALVSGRTIHARWTRKFAPGLFGAGTCGVILRGLN